MRPIGGRDSFCPDMSKGARLWWLTSWDMGGTRDGGMPLPSNGGGGAAYGCWYNPWGGGKVASGCCCGGRG